MILDMEPSKVLDLIGHDGTRRLWPDKPLPYCQRGFHIREIINVCNEFGFTLTPYDRYPVISPDIDSPVHQIWDDKECERAFREVVRDRIGIMIMQGHACAWDGSMVYDPVGKVRDLGCYNPLSCWIRFRFHETLT